jgi:stage II sporulation protein Q
MNMREEKSNNPSLPKKKSKKQAWLWPSIYVGFSLLFVGMIWGYNAYVDTDGDVAGNWPRTEGVDGSDETDITVNAQNETLKFPFDEALLDQVTVLQDFYDVTADEETRENSLLVFNQTYVTNSGISIALDGQPFEVLAALSGTVEEVNVDPFTGDEIVLKHENGLITHYRSLTGILVKKGDVVKQGQVMATATENDWNPTAGVHLQFEVIENGEAVNPRNFLAF